MEVVPQLTPKYDPADVLPGAVARLTHRGYGTDKIAVYIYLILEFVTVSNATIE